MLLSDASDAKGTRHRAYLLMLLAIVLLNTWVVLEVKRSVAIPDLTGAIQVPDTARGWSLSARSGDIDSGKAGVTLDDSGDDVQLAAFESPLYWA